MKLTNKVYDALNFVVQILIPAMGTLYFALSGIWGLPNAEKVVGSLTALDAFLGLVQTWISKTYIPPVDGHLVVNKSDPSVDKFSLELIKDLTDVKPGDKFMLKAVSPSPSGNVSSV